MKFTLVLFDANGDTVASLKTAFKDVPPVILKKVDENMYFLPPPGLDILFLPLPAAERWGSKPLIHDSQVLPTNHADQAKGLPPYIVTGTCLAPDDPRGPIPETTLLISSAFRAIREFNKCHDNHLRVIGFWAMNLLKGIDADQLRKILPSAAPELFD